MTSHPNYLVKLATVSPGVGGFSCSNMYILEKVR